jgi:hypothetical protein
MYNLLIYSMLKRNRGPVDRECRLKWVGMAPIRSGLLLALNLTCMHELET